MTQDPHNLTNEEIEVGADMVLRGAWEGCYQPYINHIIWPDPNHKFDAPSLQTIWDVVKTGSSAPLIGCLTPKDIAPERFRGALGDIASLDVRDNGFNAAYRLYGSSVAQAVEADYTGALVSDMNGKLPRDLACFYRAGYRAVYRTKAPLATLHGSPYELSRFTWQRLIIPVLDDAGDVKRFLVGVVTEETPDDEVELIGTRVQRPPVWNGK